VSVFIALSQLIPGTTPNNTAIFNQRTTGRAKKSNPLGKIWYLWNCSSYIYQMCRVYRRGFNPHILLILLK